MRALVTGVAGHLGEALAQTLTECGDEVVGVDRLASNYVSHRGDIADKDLIARAMAGVDVVFHVATLHKPHVTSHSWQAFIDTNITGTSVLLDAAIRAGARAFVFTSTTSVFGNAMEAPAGAPAIWVHEDLPPKPRNIYGVSKLAAEGLCGLARRESGLATIILRTSRFFPEEDDDPTISAVWAADNVKLNEFLYRRADIEDVARAHLLAGERAVEAGPGPFIISATTPFDREDLAGLATDAPRVLALRIPEHGPIFARKGWRMFPTIGRVYDNTLARGALEWTPKHDFRSMLERVSDGGSPTSEIASAVGAKGYHRAA